MKDKTLSKKNNFFVKNKDLLKRILFTIFILFLVRVGMMITVPGIKVTGNLANSEGVEFFKLLATLGGGSIGKFSILALGVSPYITASIITQLLSTDVIPVFTQWTKSGERGRRKIERFTKILTIPFAIMQSLATIFTLTKTGLIDPKWNGDGPKVFYYILIPCILLAGVYIMLWIADQITIRGIGNGISILIYIGIVASLPTSFIKTFEWWIANKKDPSILFSGTIFFIIYIMSFLFVILVVLLFNETERKIPIQQTGSGLTNKEDKLPYMPLKINNAGVIPVIFASALISTPITIAEIVKITNPNSKFIWFTQNILAFDKWAGISIYAILVILFTFLYSLVQINPEKIADQFSKSGTFIPGIKPGKDTERFLTGTINRLSVFGSIFLAFIASLPYIIAKLTDLPQSLAIGGTGMIIMISVSIQTIQSIKGRLIQQKFIDKKNDKFSDDATSSETHIW